MFRPGATYNAVDVHAIIINEPNDNRMPEKRLLRGTPMPMHESKTPEGKYLSTVRVTIYPFGAYYYPWVSNRWKSVTKHIYNITALRVIEKSRLKVIGSFLPMGKSSEGFTLHSSRSNLKKRKVVATALGLKDDPQNKRRGTNNSLQEEGTPDVINLGGSCDTPKDPKSLSSSEDPQLQKYTTWLSSTFDEGTVDALQGKPAKITNSMCHSTHTHGTQGAFIGSPGVFRIGSTVISLYGVGVVTQIKQLTFGESVETAFMQELSPKEHGFLVVKPVHWTLANGRAPILCLNVSICKLIAVHPTIVAPSRTIAAQPTVSAVTTNSHPRGSSHNPIPSSMPSPIYAPAHTAADVYGISGNELMMMGFMGQGMQMNYPVAPMANYAVAPIMVPSLFQQQQQEQPLPNVVASSHSSISSPLDILSSRIACTIPNSMVKSERDSQAHPLSSKEGISNDKVGVGAFPGKTHGSFGLLTGAIEALATTAAPHASNELRSEDEVDRTKEGRSGHEYTNDAENTDFDDQLTEKRRILCNSDELDGYKIAMRNGENSSELSRVDEQRSEQRVGMLKGRSLRKADDEKERRKQEGDKEEENTESRRMSFEKDDDDGQSSEDSSPVEALPAKRQRRVNTKYFEFDYPTLSKSDKRKSSGNNTPLLEEKCKCEDKSNETHDDSPEISSLSLSATGSTRIKQTKGVFTGKTFGHLTKLGGARRGAPLPAAPEKVKEVTSKRKPSNARSIAELESHLFSHQSELYGIPCAGDSCEVLCDHTEVWCPMIISLVRPLGADQFVANLSWRGWNEECMEKSFLYTDDKYFDTHNENRVVKVFKDGSRVKKYKCWVKLKMKKEDPDFPKWPGVVFVRSPETTTGVQHLLDQKTMYIELYGAENFSGDMEQFKKGLWRHAPDFKPYFYYYVDNIKKSGMASKYGAEFAAAFLEMMEDKKTSDFSFEFDGTLEVGKIASSRKNGSGALSSRDSKLSSVSEATGRKPLPPPAIPPPEHQPIAGINYIPPDHLKQRYIRIPEEQQKIFAEIARQQMSQFNTWFPHLVQFPGNFWSTQSPFPTQNQVYVQNPMAIQNQMSVQNPIVMQHLISSPPPTAVQYQMHMQSQPALQQNASLSHFYANHQIPAHKGVEYALNNHKLISPIVKEKKQRDARHS